MASFLKPEACGQTVLPDMSVLIGQKMVEKSIKKSNATFFAYCWMASFFNRRSKLSKIILLSVRPYKLYICEVKIDQSEDSKNMLECDFKGGQDV